MLEVNKIIPSSLEIDLEQLMFCMLICWTYLGVNVCCVLWLADINSLQRLFGEVRCR